MNARESAQICHSILCKKEPISVDAEGINLGTKGQMTLLQISTMEKQTYIFDLLVDSNIWIEGKLSFLQKYKVFLILIKRQTIIQILHSIKK